LQYVIYFIYNIDNIYKFTKEYKNIAMLYIFIKMFTIFCFLLLTSIVNASIIDRFHNWVSQFDIHFRDDSHFSEIYRKWVSNDKLIDFVNSQNMSYTLGHNQFSGMDTDDFRKYVQLYAVTIPDTLVQTSTNMENLQSLPISVDWVSTGAVTPVKDQGQCGSCWSFSTTGALESAYFNKYGTLVSFSEQQLVDCDNLQNGGRDHGCNGGLMDNAFSWIQKNGGLCSEKDYPYVSGSTKTAGTCSKTCKVDSNSKVQKFVDVSPNSDDEMMTALTKQTVSVAIEADQPAFQLYKSGVFTGSCGTTLDHGVLVVGYGKEGSLDYYTVKNSWGTTWGLNGYIKLGRGPSYNNGKGQCGVLMEASYPVL
jgi:C1A family cysteine protease